jgi:fatty-acyl-CoA synthase
MHIPFNILDLLQRAEHVYGDRVGVVDEPDQPADSLGALTWREVAAHARAMAAGLDALGVGPGERVAIVSPNSARLFIALFAVAGYGRVVVPINFRLNAEEVAYVVEQSGASVLLVDPELDEALAAVTAPHRFVLGRASDDVLFRFDREPLEWADADEDAVVSINYTSGTTARPKGVELSHRNLYVNALTFGWQAGVDDRDVYLWAVPMFHCNGWGLVYAVTAMGGRHVMLRKVDGPEILRRMDHHGVTFMGGAPAVINTLLATAAADPATPTGRGRVRIVVGGAPPPAATIERVETELGWEFMQIYGLTETAPLLTLNRRRAEWDELTPGERADLLGRAGPPAIGVRLAIDADGEVLARGNNVFRGYWERPVESGEALAGGWFHTGDGGRVDEHGYLAISDRKKDVIITGGENVSSIEVEDCLCRHPAVAEAAVIAVPDARWGETIKAIVVLRPGTAATPAELIAHCRERLAHFKCPTSVEVVPAIARTATGKVQKFKLRETYWREYDRAVN